MSFSNGRSTLERYIEDAVFVSEQLLSDISNHLTEYQISSDNSNSQTAKLIADGDIEVEESVRSQLNDLSIDYINILDSFYESQFFLIYSLYERTLKSIVCDFNKDFKPSDKIFANKSIKEIKNHLGVHELDSKIENSISFINKELREVRNALAHEGQVKGVCDILKDLDSKFLRDFPNCNVKEYLQFSLNQIKIVLLELAGRINFHKSL